MTSPLQIISVSDRERTIINQTYTRESIAVIHQQKERVSPSTASPFNDLAPRKNDENQNEEWTTKSHIMLPNYLLDHNDLLRQNRKRMYGILLSFQKKDKYGRVQHFLVGSPTIFIWLFYQTLSVLSLIILCARWG